MTTSQIELSSRNYTIEEKAKIVCWYNGQKGTDKQIEKVLKSYKDHDLMDRFIVPRWNAIKEMLNK